VASLVAVRLAILLVDDHVASVAFGVRLEVRVGQLGRPADLHLGPELTPRELGASERAMLSFFAATHTKADGPVTARHGRVDAELDRSRRATRAARHWRVSWCCDVTCSRTWRTDRRTRRWLGWPPR